MLLPEKSGSHVSGLQMSNRSLSYRVLSSAAMCRKGQQRCQRLPTLRPRRHLRASLACCLHLTCAAARPRPASFLSLLLRLCHLQHPQTACHAPGAVPLAPVSPRRPAEPVQPAPGCRQCDAWSLPAAAGLGAHGSLLQDAPSCRARAARGMAAPAPQRSVLGQGPGTPRSWQGSHSPAGPQQSLFSRAVPEHLDAASRQSLDSQHRVSSLGGMSRDGSRRQSLENATAGSMASQASTGCGSEPGSLANTPRTAPADTSSSLFAHAPYPASPSHALAAAAAQSAVSQLSAAYPGASRLSGHSGGLFMGAPPDALPADSMAMPDLASIQGLQHSGLSFGSGSLQLTPSHFGTNVSANTGQGARRELLCTDVGYTWRCMAAFVSWGLLALHIKGHPLASPALAMRTSLPDRPLISGYLL